MNINELKFDEIGEYKLVNGEVTSSNYNVKKSERLSIVYILTVDGEIKYIGKTIQGYRRPLNYHNNKVMKTVRDGIIDVCKNNKTVKIHARSHDFEINFEGLTVNINEGYEQALIKEIRPDWNNHIQK